MNGFSCLNELCFISLQSFPFFSAFFFVSILINNLFLLKCLLDVASKEKERLEEKQRAARKERAKDEVEWQTR